jgi:hypothetical protein
LSDRPNLDLLRKVIGDVPLVTPLDKLFGWEPSPYEILAAKESCAIFQEAVNNYVKNLKYSTTLTPPVRKRIYVREEKITPIALPEGVGEILYHQFWDCGIRDRVRNQQPGNDYFDRLMSWIREQDCWGDWESANPKMDHILVPKPLWYNLQNLYKTHAAALKLALKSILR